MAKLKLDSWRLFSVDDGASSPARGVEITEFTYLMQNNITKITKIEVHCMISRNINGPAFFSITFQHLSQQAGPAFFAITFPFRHLLQEASLSVFS